MNWGKGSWFAWADAGCLCGERENKPLRSENTASGMGDRKPAIGCEGYGPGMAGRVTYEDNWEAEFVWVGLFLFLFITSHVS